MPNRALVPPSKFFVMLLKNFGVGIEPTRTILGLDGGAPFAFPISIAFHYVFIQRQKFSRIFAT
ncbi:hypothetical protein B14911_22997 [Bacillus sp. NRRL B-14911]|uniref:Uncharacterized protein n=1 Tax=Bacillus infantis NRRL B-14911 TaxID=1367477 RepID=U5LCD7_9BACI|nr:hypothetical protein N288_15995 [Bacillus infantis NRRL B-14911]EAR66473.1 hypothetical protein B14911_22997 [Bacillus sp. NRRL B-14911]